MVLIGATDIVTDIAKMHAFSQLFVLVGLCVFPRNRADVWFATKGSKTLYRVFRSYVAPSFALASVAMYPSI